MEIKRRDNTGGLILIICGLVLIFTTIIEYSFEGNLFRALLYGFLGIFMEILGVDLYYNN